MAEIPLTHFNSRFAAASLAAQTAGKTDEFLRIAESELLAAKGPRWRQQDRMDPQTQNFVITMIECRAKFL